MSAGRGPEARPSPGAAFLLTLGAWSILFLLVGLLAPSTGMPLALAVGTTAGFGVVGTLAARAVPPPIDARLGLRGFAARWLPVLVLWLPAALLLSELDNRLAVHLERPAAVAAEATGEGSATEGETDPTASPASGPATARDGRLDLLAWSLFSVLLRPVVEEFFFRGVLQQGLVAHWGAGGGVAGAALLFAAVRATLGLGSAYTAVTLGVQALVLGLVLGFLRLATGSILAGALLQGGLAALGVAGLVWRDALAVPGWNAPGAHTLRRLRRRGAPGLPEAGR